MPSYIKRAIIHYMFHTFHWYCYQRHWLFINSSLYRIFQLPQLNRIFLFRESSSFAKTCKLWISISSRRRCSVKKGVLRNFAKFTGKHLCQSLFFNKVADLGPATLLKKRLWHRYFPANFAKFLRTLFLQKTSGWLLLNLRCLLISIYHVSESFISIDFPTFI